MKYNRNRYLGVSLGRYDILAPMVVGRHVDDHGFEGFILQFWLGFGFSRVCLHGIYAVDFYRIWTETDRTACISGKNLKPGRHSHCQRRAREIF